MQLPAWATAKLGPLPVWGWGAIAFGGGVGYVLYQRRRAGAGAATLAGNAQAVPATYPNAELGGAGIGSPGGGAGALLPGGSSDPFSGGGGGQTPYQTIIQQQPAQQQQQQPRSTSGTALTPAPAVQISPSMLGGGYLASQGTIENPASSVVPTATYQPSATDIATTQPGGIQTVQAGLPGTEPAQGLTYTIYGTNTGSGAVVPASQRIAGERYDASGRVIA